MIYWLILFIVFTFLLGMLFVINHFKTRDIINNMNVINSKNISDYNKLASNHNILVSKWNAVPRTCRGGKCGLSKPINVGLSKEDLKMLRYYLHPDKHNGKTSDLFVKINNMYN